MEQGLTWLKESPNDLIGDEPRFILLSQEKNQKRQRRSRRLKQTLMAALVVLLMAIAFIMWSSNNKFSPRAAWYVALAKTGIYTLKPEMVDIPMNKDCQKQPCEFLMGSTKSDPQAGENEQPQHRVSFNKSFKISRYEVTFDEYQVFAFLIESEGGCANNHKVEPINDSGWGTSTRPAINVSWQDAQCYVQWLNTKTNTKTGHKYRLPTEAEWEYAARADLTGDYYWGQGEAKDFAWYNDNSEGQTHLVGEKKPNAFRLYDMSGNVWEWVQDCWHDDYDKAPDDGSAWQEQNYADCTQRIMRGGSWTNVQDSLRSAYRDVSDPGNRSIVIGFRLAQD